MSLTTGQTISVAIEKPAAGGAMIARVDGQVVLVTGAIPGEHVRARVTRIGKGVAYAETVDVDEPSSDRRPPFTDPACGGCAYAHIAYPRQLEIKSAVIADAFARIGRLELATAPAVRSSPEEAYRMRARLHVRGGRIGFFREGTHDVCDVGPTRQLLPATVTLLDRIAAAFRSVRLETVREIELSENLDASQRAIALVGVGQIPTRVLEAIATTDGLTGTIVTLQGSPIVRTIAGSAFVTDELRFGETAVRLRRHVLAFFQGNRFLLQSLAGHVLDLIDANSRVLDFYAGAGLFAVCAAAVRGAQVTAIEGDRLGAADLEANIAAAALDIRTVHQPVESFVAAGPPTAISIVDPPRTGMSREALANIVAVKSPRIVYVSCDVATLARDARKIIDSGYRLRSVDAFDLFPNTPHVETIAVFDRA